MGSDPTPPLPPQPRCPWPRQSSPSWARAPRPRGGPAPTPRGQKHHRQSKRGRRRGGSGTRTRQPGDSGAGSPQVSRLPPGAAGAGRRVAWKHPEILTGTRSPGSGGQGRPRRSAARLQQGLHDSQRAQKQLGPSEVGAKTSTVAGLRKGGPPPLGAQVELGSARPCPGPEQQGGPSVELRPACPGAGVEGDPQS